MLKLEMQSMNAYKRRTCRLLNGLVEEVEETSVQTAGWIRINMAINSKI